MADVEARLDAIAEFTTRVVQKQKEWMATLSEEQLAAIAADAASWKDQAQVPERMAEVQATFNAADTNQDGLLDRNEMHDFMAKGYQNAVARGTPARDPSNMSDEEKDAFYAAMNSLSDAEGVSMGEFMAWGKRYAVTMAQE